MNNHDTTPIFVPGLLGRARIDRAFLAETASFHPALVDAKRYQIIAYGARTPFTECQIIFPCAALIGVALNPDRDASILLEP